MSAPRFAECVAVVTGGGSGIGLATVKRLAAEGARIAVAELDSATADAAAAAALAAGAPDAFAAPCNVAMESDVERTVAEALRRFGRLDVVVNNAGRMNFRPLVEQTRADWLGILEVNLLGAFYFVRAAFNHMRTGGTIVNVASVHAFMTSQQVAPYAASKAALVSLTRSASIEGAALGIRVNAVIPGAIDTPMLWSNPNIASGAEKISAADVGRPEDVAAAIAYLASADARFIQGAALCVDGGRLDRL